MTILLISASREVSLVRAFQQALSQEDGGTMIAADMNPRAPALYVADERLLIPPSDDEHFISVLLAFCKKRNVRLIFSTRDEDLPILAIHKPQFSAIGTQVMVADPNTIRTCQDKLAFHDFCVDNDFGVPKVYKTMKAAVDHFPVFVKPQYGKGSKNSQPVHSKEELEMLKKKNAPLIIQEYLRSPEYSIDLFTDFSGTVISVVPRKRMVTVGGESYVAQTYHNHHLLTEATRLARRLKLIGHNTIQCFFDGTTVQFIEVNPRFGGGANLGFSAGAPTPQYLVKLLLGKKVKPDIGNFKDHYVMLRYTQDFFLDEHDLEQRP